MSKKYEVNVSPEVVKEMIMNNWHIDKTNGMIELLEEFKSELNKDKHTLIKANLEKDKKIKELESKLKTFENSKKQG